MYEYLDLYQVERQRRDLEAAAHRDPLSMIPESYDDDFDTLDLDDLGERFVSWWRDSGAGIGMLDGSPVRL